MARTPNSYWERRSTELMKRLEKGTENTINGLIEAYEQATKNINNEIANIFKNYSKGGVLTSEQLKQMLTTKETEEYYSDLLKTINTRITNDPIKKKLLAKYNAPAYSYRISRYEALQQNIDIELKKLANAEQNLTETRYINTIKEGYYHNIYDIQRGTGYAFSFAQIDNRTINMLLNEKWVDNKNFSQRIWGNNEKLGNYLRTQLTANSMSGKSVQRIASELSEHMSVGLLNATRLVRTEVNHFANEAELLSYKELDIEKYRYIATLDQVTCKHCAKLDNQVIEIKDLKNGVNFPPLHANDRCTTVAEFDDEVTEELERRARDESGKPILVPQDISYTEWMKNKDYVYQNNKSSGTNTIVNKDNISKYSSSNVLKIKTYEDLKKYFKDLYSVSIEGFEKIDLEDVKATFAGIDDILRDFKYSGKLHKITYSARLTKSFGESYSKGIITIGKLGINNYETGIHEAMHQISFSRDYPSMRNYFSRNVWEEAESRFSKKKFYKGLFEINKLHTDNSLLSQDEILAYSAEMEYNKKGNDISKMIIKIAREKYNE